MTYRSGIRVLLRATTAEETGKPQPEETGIILDSHLGVYVVAIDDGEVIDVPENRIVKEILHD